jgi:predicted DNA-binding transcriptional regulator AlpA
VTTEPNEIATRFLTVQKLMQRWGCCHMTVERLIRNDPTFPKAMRLNRIRLYRLADIEKFERSKVTGNATRAA